MALFALVMKSKPRRTQQGNYLERRPGIRGSETQAGGDQLADDVLFLLLVYSCFFCSVVCFGRLAAAIFKDFREMESQNK